MALLWTLKFRCARKPVLQIVRSKINDNFGIE